MAHTLEGKGLDGAKWLEEFSLSEYTEMMDVCDSSAKMDTGISGSLPPSNDMPSPFGASLEPLELEIQLEGALNELQLKSALKATGNLTFVGSEHKSIAAISFQQSGTIQVPQLSVRQSGSGTMADPIQFCEVSEDLSGSQKIADPIEFSQNTIMDQSGSGAITLDAQPDLKEDSDSCRPEGLTYHEEISTVVQSHVSNADRSHQQSGSTSTGGSHQNSAPSPSSSPRRHHEECTLMDLFSHVSDPDTTLDTGDNDHGANFPEELYNPEEWNSPKLIFEREHQELLYDQGWIGFFQKT